jgi:urease accessory protein
VTLHPGALLILQEIVMPGRLARGEVLEFRRYANRLTVRDDQGLLVYDNLRYEPQAGDLTRLGLFDGYPCWGSWYAVGDLRGLNAAAFCEAYQSMLPDNDQSLAGISTLHRSGIGARVVAKSLAPIYTTFTQLWQDIRAEVLHLPTTVLRK